MLEVSEEAVDPASNAARLTGDEEPAPTLRAGLLFHPATPIRSSIRPTRTVKSPGRSPAAIAVRQPLGPSVNSGRWTPRASPKTPSPAKQPLPSPQTLTCSSCGTVGHGDTYSSLKPCAHLLCRVCVNTLVNSACLDPPPDALRCFLCSEEVTGFDKVQHAPSAPSPFRTPPRVKIVDPATGMELSPIRQLDWSATPSSTKSVASSSAGDASNLWSTPKSQTSLKSAISTPGSSVKQEPHARAPWPVVRGACVCLSARRPD